MKELLKLLPVPTNLKGEALKKYLKQQGRNLEDSFRNWALAKGYARKNADGSTNYRERKIIEHFGAVLKGAAKMAEYVAKHGGVWTA